jgi:HlyD family secretion protein
MAASTVQNVVTFPVIVQASNPELKLFPGMTANLAIETGRNENALIVPSAALRFTPEDVLQTGDADRSSGGRAAPRRRSSRIWIVGDDGKTPEPIEVQQQLTDGTNVSLLPQDATLSLEDRDVILGTASGATASSAPNNPFAMPRMPGARTR